MRALFLTLLTVAFIVLLVILMGRGQERIAAESAPAEAARADAADNRNPAASSEAGKETASAPSATVAATPLERVPAREPLSVATTGKPAAKSEPKPAFQILSRPAIVAPGVIETTRGRVSLKGIVPLPPFAVCGEGNSAWPCGQVATSQLQRFLRARSVNCDIPDAFWQGEVAARCMRGNEDVAGWLVENGWAKAQSGSAYEAAGREAEAQRRGIFGADPRGK